jgi:xanthine dehydrogenase accessory factor
MNENEFLAQTINTQLTAGSPVVLVSVMSVQGSGPRHSGAKMVVGADGTPYGTIGGSLIEDAAIRESKTVLSTGQPKILSYELTGKDVTSPDMICGGTTQLLLDYIPAIEKNRVFFRHWHDMVRRGQEFYFLTYLKGKGDSVQVLHHALLHSDGSAFGDASFSEIEIESLKPELHNISSTYVLNLKDTRVLVDRIRRMKTLYCFGAGHVAVPTAHLAALVGFRVVVVDDRSDFANAERFPEAHDILVIDDFNKAFDGLEIDEDSCIVIVTRGHQYDRVVLEQSLKTSAGYIGMISSRRKREAIYEALMAQGVKREQLETVHSPIGINIGGETPEEIAVSIVAELIQARSRQSA